MQEASVSQSSCTSFIMMEGGNFDQANRIAGFFGAVFESNTANSVFVVL